MKSESPCIFADIVLHHMVLLAEGLEKALLVDGTEDPHCHHFRMILPIHTKTLEGKILMWNTA